MTGDLAAAIVCRTAACAAIAGSVPLAVNGDWVWFGLVLWLVLVLLVVGGFCHRGHAHLRRQARLHHLQTRTSTTTRKDTSSA